MTLNLAVRDKKTNQREQRLTELVYTTALGWSDEKFEYWISRAESEFDWKLLRAPDLANNIAERNVIIVGGSGRHAFAAVRKGFRHVTYIDLTKGNIDRAKRWARGQGVDNLTIVHSGFLEWNSATELGDLVVMNGVMQHLSAPEAALRKAAALAKVGGVCYFDCYSAGSFYFLINEWLRLFYKPEEFDHVMSLIDILGLDVIDLSFTSATMTERLSDDLFVPYIACYVERDIADSLTGSGFEILHRDHCPLVNHNLPRYDSYQFLIRRTSASNPNAIDFDPVSNFDMDYRNQAFVEPTMGMMQSLKGRISVDWQLRDKLMIGLMLRFHDWTKRKLNGRASHAELQEYLEKFL